VSRASIVGPVVANHFTASVGYRCCHQPWPSSHFGWDAAIDDLVLRALFASSALKLSKSAHQSFIIRSDVGLLPDGHTGVRSYCSGLTLIKDGRVYLLFSFHSFPFGQLVHLCLHWIFAKPPSSLFALVLGNVNGEVNNGA
jgi:hypothetical protein